jgi:hypothetical protein
VCVYFLGVLFIQFVHGIYVALDNYPLANEVAKGYSNATVLPFLSRHTHLTFEAALSLMSMTWVSVLRLPILVYFISCIMYLKMQYNYAH